MHLPALSYIPDYVSRCRPKNRFPIVTRTTKVSIVYDNKATKLDSISANLLAEDIERVTSFKPVVLTDIIKAKNYVIAIGNVQSAFIQNFLRAQSETIKQLKGQ